MITGARHGTLSGLRRLVAFAMAHDLGVYIIPGPEIARLHNLDIAATGMRIVASPRHASVLLLVGEIPPVLREAAAVIYAQMMRPRVLFVLQESPGSTELLPLPAADIVTDISQQALIKGVSQLRTVLATGAFRPDVSDFDAPILQIRIEYTCSMHPEISESEPGSCPKCGMDLIQREVQATVGHTHTETQNLGSEDHTDMDHDMDHDTAIEYTCSMHPEVSEKEPGSCPRCGMNLVPRDAQAESGHEHHGMGHDAAIEYTCSMHPEISESEPGSCPECGMTLEPRDIAVEYTCSMHPEISESEPGSCPRCGMTLVPRDAQAESGHEHHGMGHDAAIEYTCAMHPEVSESEPGSCPECGMTLEPRQGEPKQSHDHAGMDHSTMDHGEAFMSMIDVTKDLPLSGDGLAMDWINVPFGPFFPGLPGGLLLTLTLDGDTVAGSSANALVGNQPLLLETEMGSNSFSKRLASLAPLTPISYQVLACLAIENAAGLEVDPQIALARVVAVERERIVSHLGWLVLFAEQTGFDWLQNRATLLQQNLLRGDIKQKQVSELKSAIITLNKRLRRTPLLKSRTTGIGKLIDHTDITLLGPVARASGIIKDARSNDNIYRDLGFTPTSGENGDARARLQLRLDEISQSLVLIEKAGFTTSANIFNSNGISENSGAGEAVLETPRGLAHLQVSLENGQVIDAKLETPSTHHLDLIEQLTAQQELGDALVAVGSLDLSPWEIRL